MTRDMIALIEPHIPSLRRYARSLLRDRAAADDLVQDSLERAITRWHQRRRENDARAWLFTIVHNLAINRLRQGARRGAHVPIDAVDEVEFAAPPQQEDRLHHQAILDALSHLSEEHQSVLLLISVEELSYAEVASVVGVPVGTVMSRLSRARRQLADLLDETRGARAETLPILRRVK